MKTLILTLAMLFVFAQVAYSENFAATLNGSQVVPPNSAGSLATCKVGLSRTTPHIQVQCFISAPSVGTTLHIHGPAAPGAEGPLLFSFPASTGSGVFVVDAQQIEALRSHRLYIDMHNPTVPLLDVRGQIARAETISDSDGDGRTDPTIFRRSTQQIWVLSSMNGARVYNLPDVGNAVYLTNAWRSNWWFVAPTNPENGLVWYWIFGGPLGSPGVGAVTMPDVSHLDSLVPGDFNGDGVQDRAVFLRSTGEWRLIAPGVDSSIHWGSPGDEPCVGDYDGDGYSDLCVARNEGGTLVWYIRKSSNSQLQREEWGVGGVDRVLPSVPVYLDGDGKQDLMVYREVGSQRVFMVRQSTDNAWVEISWGLTSDTPLFGDYDGDGRTDFAARRDVGGSYVWYVRRSSDGQVQYFYWGKTGDE